VFTSKVSVKAGSEGQQLCGRKNRGETANPAPGVAV
jgi:hypothetical protein